MANAGSKNRQYNGHRNRNCWKVYMWMSCTEGLDRHIARLVAKHGIGRTSEMLHEELKGLTTSDGTTFSKVAVRDAVRGLA